MHEDCGENEHVFGDLNLEKQNDGTWQVVERKVLTWVDDDDGSDGDDDGGVDDITRTELQSKSELPLRLPQIPTELVIATKKAALCRIPNPMKVRPCSPPSF